MKKQFGERLQSVRRTKSVSQADVAAYIGVTTAAYQNYESGRREAGYEVITKLADFYGVSTDYLLGRETPPPDPVSQLAAQLGLSPLERAIVASYIAMDAEHRKDLVKLVCELADGTKDEKTQKSATCGEIEEARKSVEEAS